MATAPKPSGWHAGGAIILAGVLAGCICIGLALISNRYHGNDHNVAWEKACRTGNARGLTLPPVCLSCYSTDCDKECEEECKEGCPQRADGREVWFDEPEPRPGQLQLRWETNVSLTSGVDVITAWCSFSAIDLTSYMTTVGCEITFWGRFDNGSRFLALPWPVNDTEARAVNAATLVIALGSTKMELKSGDTDSTVKFEVGLGAWWRGNQVDAESYPNVSLPFSLWFAAWWKDGANQVLDPEPPLVVDLEFNYLPLYLFLGLKCSNTTYPNNGTTWYALTGSIQLSDAAKAGVMSLNACMWILTATTFTLSLVWCLLAEPEDHVRFDLMCFSAALLFALPAMRQTLPAISAGGTRFDVLNLHGQLWLIATSILLQVLKMLCAVVKEEVRRANPAQPAHEPQGSVFSSWMHKLCDGKL
jgi:hypothetical protein